MSEKVNWCEREQRLRFRQRKNCGFKLLEEQLERYQAQCHRLQGQNKDVAANNKVLQDDMPDTLECLQQQEIEKDMSEQVEKQLQVDRKTTKKDLELLINQDRKEMQEMEEQLISVETMLASRIEDQKQQLVNMEQQILKNESLKEMFIQLQDQVKEEKRIKEEKIKPQFEEERKKQSQLKEICQLEEKTELELRKVKSLSQTAIKLRIIAFKQIRQIHSLKETSVKLTKQKDLMMRQINKLQRWKQNHEDIKDAYRQLRAQKVSSVDQLEEKLEQERSRTRELEKDLKRAAFVLRDVATDPKNPEARLKLQEVLQILGASELQENGTSLDQSSGANSGELKTQTQQEEDSSSTGSQDISKDLLFLMEILRLKCMDGSAVFQPTAAASQEKSEL